MHLRDGGGAQGLVVEGGVKLADRLAQILLDLGVDGVHVHGRHLGAQLGQRLAVFGGQVLGLLGRDLPDLHEGRPQVLQDVHRDLRRNAVVVIVLFQDGQNLLEPSAGVRLCLLRVLALLHQRGDKA